MSMPRVPSEREGAPGAWTVAGFRPPPPDAPRGTRGMDTAAYRGDMTDLPFGFNPSPNPDDRGEGSSGGGNTPPGGMPPGGVPFDIGQLGQMLSQLGQMLSQAQTSGGGGPVNYDLAKQIAVQQLAQSGGTAGADQSGAVADAVHLAEMWLDPVTTLPAGARVAKAWSATDWVNETLPTWQRLFDPVAQRVSGAWVDALPEEAKAAAGPMLAMVGQMGGMAFGSQLGNALAQLAAEVLTSTEVGLPLGPEGTAALLPANIEKFTGGLERPASEVMVFLAAREAAHQRLFAHVPWLRQRLLATVEEFARASRSTPPRWSSWPRRSIPATPRASRTPCGPACSNRRRPPSRRPR
ncbi:hypothetical protein GCM10018954_011870 [Kutzneria kofuensis]